jgi:hypothetical protein
MQHTATTQSRIHIYHSCQRVVDCPHENLTIIVIKACFKNTMASRQSTTRRHRINERQVNVRTDPNDSTFPIPLLFPVNRFLNKQWIRKSNKKEQRTTKIDENENTHHAK